MSNLTNLADAAPQLIARSQAWWDKTRSGGREHPFLRALEKRTLM